MLLVSHDRDFIDRVATTTVAMEGDGRAVIYAGGWTDYRAQRGEDAAAAAGAAARRGARRRRRGGAGGGDGAARLSFTQAHRLEALPAEIDRLAAEIGRLEALLGDPELFTREPGKFAKASAALVARQEALAAAEEEWLTLEALREAAEGGRPFRSDGGRRLRSRTATPTTSELGGDRVALVLLRRRASARGAGDRPGAHGVSRHRRAERLPRPARS